MTTEPADERIARLSPAKRALLEHLLADRRSPGTPDVLRRLTPEARLLLRLCSEALRVDGITTADSFIGLGGDSITSLLVAAKATAAGFPLTSRQLLEATSLGQVAADLGQATRTSVVVDVPTGPADLTPIQRWFFEQRFPEAHHWHQTIVVELRERPEPTVLAAAVNLVVARHEVLSSAFVDNGGDWSQVVLDEAVEVDLHVVSLDQGADDDTVVRHAGDVVGRTADLATGRLVTAILFLDERRADRLLLAVHHLVVDGVSMRVLIDDIEVAYHALEADRQPDFPPRTTSYRCWSQVLTRHASSADVAGELAYWQSVPAASAALLPVEVDGSAGRVANCATVRAEVPASVASRLLRDVPRGSRFQVHHVLLAALLLAWHRVAGCTRLQVDLEAHGREQVDGSVDVSRTVGWFTAMDPSVFEDVAGTPLEALRAVRDTYAKVPTHGIGYGLLRYLADPGAAGLADGPRSSSVSIISVGSTGSRVSCSACRSGHRSSCRASGRTAPT